VATLALCAVLIPLAVSIAAVARREWHPSSDVALELFQVNEVGGSRTPLTGAWSKWGWDHPGPMLFWILAPFTWLFGTNGALIGTIVINGTAMAGGDFVAQRRGGDPLAVWSASLLLLLSIGLGPEHLFDPWNPWVAVLPFFPFLLLAWSVGEGDLAMAPYFVVAGSFLVQTHVGYAPLVAGMGLFALVMAISTLRRSRSRPPGGSH